MFNLPGLRALILRASATYSILGGFEQPSPQHYMLQGWFRQQRCIGLLDSVSHKMTYICHQCPSRYHVESSLVLNNGHSHRSRKTLVNPLCQPEEVPQNKFPFPRDTGKNLPRSRAWTRAGKVGRVGPLNTG